MNKKSVLFIINGFGMGNTTRCDAVIEFLSDRYSIDVITSDKGHIYFSESDRIRKLFKQMDMNLGSGHAYASLLFVLCYVPYFIKRLFVNYRLQKTIIGAGAYDAIFFDSDYGFIFHKIFKRTRSLLIGINNSFEIVRFFERNRDELKSNLWLSFLLENLDFWVYKLFCDFVFCPAIDPSKLAVAAKSKILVIPLLVRSKFVPTEDGVGSPSGPILIMPSSSNVKSKISEISHSFFADEKEKIVEPSFQTSNYLVFKNASAVVCNAGQSSIAECLYLKKPALVVSIENHAEQWANAKLAEGLGLCRYSDGMNPNEFKLYRQNHRTPSSAFEINLLQKALAVHFSYLGFEV